MFSNFYVKSYKCKNFKPNLLYCWQNNKKYTKKNKQKTKANYAIYSNNMATLLAVLLLLQLSHQIKSKRKKPLNSGNFELILSKAVCAAFLAPLTFSFSATIISTLRWSRRVTKLTEKLSRSCVMRKKIEFFERERSVEYSKLIRNYLKKTKICKFNSKP